MHTGQLPGIIQQRWAAACAEPSIPRWRSLAIWCEDFAEQLEAARYMAGEAYSNMIALQPVRECEAAA
jgi:hypothetical protein